MTVNNNGNGTLLQVVNVSKAFGGFEAVCDVSFSVEKEEIVGLIGPNGAGKTTLFNVVCRFLSVDSGTVDFRGHSLETKPAYAATKLGLVRTFQISRVFSRMTVLENLLFAAPSQRGENLVFTFFRPGFVRRQEKEIAEKAHEIMDYFHLTPLRNEYAGALSGGQKKLLEMARALMTSPEMILLDEPMAGVNPALKQKLQEYIMDLRVNHGKTFLIVEHDIDMIMRMSDRILTMAEGKLIAEGGPEEIRNNPSVIDAYLGRAQ